MTVEQTKDVIRETDADGINLARRLLRSARYGSLGVLAPDGGAPLVSRVALATEPDGTPLILVSALSSHTPALLTDPRCSLLVGEPGKGDPLAHPRMTLSCHAEKLERGSAEQEAAARRYLMRQPKAKLYSDFADFSYFRLRIEGASLNGGFARAYRLTRNDLILDTPVLADLAAAEAAAVEHMNEDHADAVSLYAVHYGKAEALAWRLTGIDPEGMDLMAGDTALRILFPEPLADARQMQPMLVRMAKEARLAQTSLK